jgi:hypothetical protein
MDLVSNNVIYCTKTEATETVLYTGHCTGRSCCAVNDRNTLLRRRGYLQLWQTINKWRGERGKEWVRYPAMQCC